MPLGADAFPDPPPGAVTVTPQPATRASIPGYGPPAPQDQCLHETIKVAQWVNGLYVVDFAGPVQRVEVYAGPGDALVLVWGGPATVGGAYDAFHPGGGELTKPAPNVVRLGLATVSGLAPLATVEVYGHGGGYARVPV